MFPWRRWCLESRIPVAHRYDPINAHSSPRYFCAWLYFGHRRLISYDSKYQCNQFHFRWVRHKVMWWISLRILELAPFAGFTGKVSRYALPDVVSFAHIKSTWPFRSGNMYTPVSAELIRFFFRQIRGNVVSPEFRLSLYWCSCRCRGLTIAEYFLRFASASPPAVAGSECVFPEALGKGQTI